MQRVHSGFAQRKLTAAIRDDSETGFAMTDTLWSGTRKGLFALRRGRRVGRAARPTGHGASHRGGQVACGVSEPLLGRLLMVDALTMRFDEFKVTRRSDCAVCEDQPTIHVPRESAAPTCSADRRGRVQHLRPADLRRLLARGHVRVIDVREPADFATARSLRGRSHFD